MHKSQPDNPVSIEGSGLPSRRGPAWVLLHFMAIVLVLTSLLTGLRVATQSRPEVMHFSALLPQGYIHGLHLLSALGLVSVTVAYTVHLIFFRGGRATVTPGAGFYYRIISWFGRIALLISIFSGGLHYFALVPSVWVVTFHYAAALAMVLYFVLHGGAYFTQYGMSAFRRVVLSAKFESARDGVVVAVTVTVFIALLNLVEIGSHHSLSVKQVPPTEIFHIDGVANEAAWQDATEVTVHTFGGANFSNGQTPITVKAIHNGMAVFFHVTWEDSTRSMRHLPLVKTQGGWQVRQSGYYRFDETEYFEDKLAVMLARNCDFGASKAARLGPEPLADKPPNWHGKGYHYVTDGEIRDVWHWKAVRTNDMLIADDNFFGTPDVVRTGLRRYTAGYLPDAKESGAYLMNWQWYRQDRILPKRLPRQAQDLAPYQSSGDMELRWSIPWYSYDLYEAANDNYPPGTIMPSVLYASNGFEGDRADVRAHGKWREGRWSLELVRKFDTGSKQDVVLESGICMWLAAFDHAQIAHTRHTLPLRLEFSGHDD